jgi:hypothetical protein
MTGIGELGKYPRFLAGLPGLLKNRIGSPVSGGIGAARTENIENTESRLLNKTITNRSLNIKKTYTISPFLSSPACNRVRFSLVINTPAKRILWSPAN